MILLFIHQNFPAQYRHLARYYADRPENTVYFITQANDNAMAGVNKITYTLNHTDREISDRLTVDFNEAVRTGVAVADVCRRLQAEGIRPDIIIGHNGWGETLFVKDVFPDVPLLAYFEFYYHRDGVDVGFDPEFVSIFDDLARLRTKNAVNLIGMDAADWGHTPTRWQQSLYPPEMRRRISVIHEGVDTDATVPNPRAWIRLARSGRVLTAKDEIITYVARNLEPYRGFHIFMRALPEILRRRPRAHVLIVGGDDVSYGYPALPGTTYRTGMLQEVGNRLDLDRVHFLGRVPYDVYLNILQVSSAHIYLTYPFVLSWSFIEAMSCGCLVIGSATPPVMEVLEDGVNGLSVDFFSPEEIAGRVEEVFAHSDRLAGLRAQARETAIANFDLRRRQLPRWDRFIYDIANERQPPISL
jgi:glycosyltransferase involved in cell wall biosynthesis